MLLAVAFFTAYKVFFNTKDSQIKSLKKSTDSIQELISNLKDPIKTINSEVARFKIPMDKIQRYLSGGTLAGKFGEWGAQSIIEDILPTSAFNSNVEIKKGSGKRVEFTVKLPEGLVPIDAKFQSGLYDTYIEASENNGDVKSAKSAIRRRVIADAKDIKEKYIQKGVTIDLGIMFIPSEGILQLIDSLDEVRREVFRDYRVLILGPNNLAAYLVTINAGFQSIALNDRAEEILNEFGKLSAEFDKFSKSTEELSKKLNDAQGTVDKHVTRERQMKRAIENMELLSMHAEVKEELK